MHTDAEVISVVLAKAGTQGHYPGVTEKRRCVYILASRRNGTLHVGVTSDLARRIMIERQNRQWRDPYDDLVQ